MARGADDEQIRIDSLLEKHTDGHSLDHVPLDVDVLRIRENPSDSLVEQLVRRRLRLESIRWHDGSKTAHDIDRHRPYVDSPK